MYLREWACPLGRYPFFCQCALRRGLRRRKKTLTRSKRTTPAHLRPLHQRGAARVRYVRNPNFSLKALNCCFRQTRVHTSRMWASTTSMATSRQALLSMASAWRRPVTRFLATTPLAMRCTVTTAWRLRVTGTPQRTRDGRRAHENGYWSTNGATGLSTGLPARKHEAERAKENRRITRTNRITGDGFFALTFFLGALVSSSRLPPSSRPRLCLPRLSKPWSDAAVPLAAGRATRIEEVQ